MRPFIEVFDWEGEARRTLNTILETENPEDILPHVLAPEEVRDLVLDDQGTDEPLYADAFSAIYLAEGMQDEGFYGMIYRRPAFSGMRYLMRPIVEMEVERGLKRADLWDGLARLEAFDNIPARGRVTAFFKREGDRLFLDWEMFTQSRDRLLQQFASGRNNREADFRINVYPVHPAVAEKLSNEHDSKGRWFWIQDPSFEHFRYPLFVPDHSKPELLNHPWEPANQLAPHQAATIQLKWHDSKDVLILSQWVCWNFKNLPGAVEKR